MLYSPLCFCFQGQRLLIIDLQPHYKSGAEGSLPCCLLTAASIPHSLASPATHEGRGALITPCLCWAAFGFAAGLVGSQLCHNPLCCLLRFLLGQ